MNRLLIILLTASSAFSQFTDWRQLDQGVSLQLQGSNAYAGSDYFFELVSLLSPAIETGGVLTLGAGHQTREFQITAITLLTAQTLTLGFKYLINRERPDRTYHPRLWNTRITPSFPSGHTTSSAAWATIMSLQNPDYAPAFWGFVLLSGYSQVYTGNHYISDVLAGLTLGILTGVVVNNAIIE